MCRTLDFPIAFRSQALKLNHLAYSKIDVGTHFPFVFEKKCLLVQSSILGSKQSRQFSIKVLSWMVKLITVGSLSFHIFLPTLPIER